MDFTETFQNHYETNNSPPCIMICGPQCSSSTGSRWGLLRSRRLSVEAVVAFTFSVVVLLYTLTRPSTTSYEPGNMWAEVGGGLVVSGAV